METVIIPYRSGFGKSGNSKSGKKHALIQETSAYPRAFSDYQDAVLKEMQPQDDKKKFLSICNKYFLFEKLPKSETEVVEFSLPSGDRLVFFNVDKCRKPYLMSFKCDDYEIKLN